jgi:hypothetical protein
VELLVILFFFGLSSGAIAKIKGSSFVLWFVIGFCLPVFGTLLALVYRNERSTRRRPCPECGHVVPLYDQVCGRCGADLDFPSFTQERLFEA